jgi:hypothetical protein
MFGLIIWACLTVSPHAQSVTTRPEQLAGPWEMATPSRVDGIFLMIHRSSAQPESIQVRVYHRSEGSESGGWYVVSPVTSDAAARFDGTNLHVFPVTVTFDLNAAHWTGEWILGGQPRRVVLERPRLLEGSTPSPLSGVWENVPDTTRPQPTPATSVRIHIVQSADAVLTAWMDIVSVVVPQRVESETRGRSMKVESADPANVILQNLSPTFSRLGRFTGALSDDGNSLTGTWNGSAPMSFRRIR